MPLNTKWIAINKRPFAIEPLTGIMMPDGIFDTAISRQQIVCHVSNTTGQSLVHLKIRIKSISDPGILLLSNNQDVQAFLPDTARMLKWDADFSNAKPGKHVVEFEVVPWSATLNRPIYKPQIVTKTIFVTATSYDEARKTYSCSVPEGRLEVRITSVIGPHLLSKWRDRQFARKNPFLGPLLIKSIELNVVYVDPFEGKFGPIPFNDPWWKVVAVIVCVVAFIGAIVAAIMGFGTAYIGLKGEDFVDLDSGEPACYNCELDTWGGEDQASVAGALSIVALLALAVALMDEIDPWRRGQENSNPAIGEKTNSESVNVQLDYPQPPISGTNYPVKVEWAYQRVTNQNVYKHSAAEINRNSHVVSNVRIWSSKADSFAKESVDLFATVARPGGKLFRGDELYAFAIVRGPNNLSARVDLTDEGISPDKTSGDGIFSGTFNPAALALEANQHVSNAIGRWKVYVVIQDVNDAHPDMPPLEAATHIGGYALHAPFPLSIDGTKTCPDASDLTIAVS